MQYAISLFSADELRSLQRRCVDAFAVHRRPSTHPTAVGLKQWMEDTSGCDDLSGYVHAQIGHHVLAAVDQAMDVPECVCRWLSHWPVRSLSLYSRWPLLRLVRAMM